MGRSRKLLWFFIVVVGILDVYLIGRWKFHLPGPVDLVQHLTGDEITFSECSANRYFTKYAYDNDMVYFWPDGADNASLHWDTTVRFTISFRGRNNLSSPETIDSIWVVNSKTREVYLRIKQGAGTLAGRAPFSGFIALREGYFGLIGLNEWRHPTHDRSADSLASARFQTHSLAIHFFTSAGVRMVVPDLYWTFPIDQSQIDSVRAA